jgi:GNAT superfamily N-acetyltransferase
VGDDCGMDFLKKEKKGKRIYFLCGLLPSCFLCLCKLCFLTLLKHSYLVVYQLVHYYLLFSTAVRKEPEEHCLSSLECCVQTLKLLEPHNPNAHRAATHLLAALQLLVNQQMDIKLVPDPRHVKLRHVSQLEKDRRRIEIETTLFPSSTITTTYKNSATATTTTTTTTASPDSNNLVTVVQTQKPRLMAMQLEDGSTLRKLRHVDAPLVRQHWEQYGGSLTTASASSSVGEGGDAKSSSSSSLSESIARRIDKGVACFGIFRGHDLIAFVVQYENGVLGMLYVQESYRNRGYGTILIQVATKALEEHQLECIAWIVDGNTASETVFTNCGWVKENPHQKRGTGSRRAPRKWIRNGHSARNCMDSGDKSKNNSSNNDKDENNEEEYPLDQEENKHN